MNQINVTGSSTTNDNVSRMISQMNELNTQLDKTNFLFDHNTSKREDSHILDYIHGNSLLFGRCRKAVIRESDTCYFCQRQEDGPLHQLFFCEEVQDSTHNQLMEVVENPDNYIEEVLLPHNRDIQMLFINRVKFLIGQHDFLEELDHSETI